MNEHSIFYKEIVTFQPKKQNEMKSKNDKFNEKIVLL